MNRRSSNPDGMKRYVMGRHIVVMQTADGSYSFWDDAGHEGAAEGVAHDIQVPCLDDTSGITINYSSTPPRYLLKKIDFEHIPTEILAMFNPRKNSTIDLWGTEVGVRRGEDNSIIINAGGEFIERLKNEGIESSGGDYYSTLCIFPPGIKKEETAGYVRATTRPTAHQRDESASEDRAIRWVVDRFTQRTREHTWEGRELTQAGKEIMKNILASVSAQEKARSR